MKNKLANIMKLQKIWTTVAEQCTAQQHSRGKSISRFSFFFQYHLGLKMQNFLFKVDALVVPIIQNITQKYATQCAKDGLFSLLGASLTD